MRVGVLGGTTAIDVVRTEKVKRILRVKDGESVCIQRINGGYTDAIRQLCDGDVAYVFGDRDSLNFAVNHFIKEEESGPRDGRVDNAKKAVNVQCDVLVSGSYFSYEPYGLVINEGRTELHKIVQEGVYRFF
jgi:ABC-type amino acid transport substrate-binding protein